MSFLRGTVKFFNPKEGALYGFLECPQLDRDVFFHLRRGGTFEDAGGDEPRLGRDYPDPPAEGDAVLFDYVTNAKGYAVKTWGTLASTI